MIKLSMPDMYPATPETKKDMSYPTIQLPLTIMGKRKPSLGDKFKITLMAEVCGVNEDEYSASVRFQVMEGEAKSEGSEKE